MQLNLAGRGALLALLLVVATASQVTGNFAASPGFSGRAGITCIACHTDPPLVGSPAKAILEGLPPAWEPGQTYTLTIRVEGGPLALPAPAPQGGFDLDVGAGHLVLHPEDAEKLRLPNPQEATYEPQGTMQREWSVDWVAPGLADYPAAVPVWLAVLSASGNHVVALNLSDGGERFDAAASLTASVPPAPSVLEAWRALPLRAPSASASREGTTWTLDGRHEDGNASRLLWRLDNGPWQARDTAATWKLSLPGLSGEHKITLRSEGRERVSADTTLALSGPESLLEKATGTPSVAPAVLVVALLAITFLARRSRNP